MMSTNQDLPLTEATVMGYREELQKLNAKMAELRENAMENIRSKLELFAKQAVSSNSNIYYHTLHSNT